MGRIERLSEDVINRIAAGEVVQRPSAALKELLENSLDAEATSVQVTAQGGGLEVLQVTDDGTGIHVKDLPLLCERYATSKLKSFEDLQSIASFGFRGEALASLSYVSHVTVTTKRRPTHTEDEGEDTVKGVAWRATYGDGKLMSSPVPCASNYGTTIRADNMFYNAQVRRQALKAAVEWGKVVDVVTRYALAFPRVGVSCRKLEENQTGSYPLVLPKDSTLLSNIRIAYGNSVSSHLKLIYHYDTSGDWEGPSDNVEALQQSKPTPHSQDSEIISKVEAYSKSVAQLHDKAGEGKFSIVGYTSDSTLSNRKSYLCLFINNRLVESSAVRKSLDSVYTSVLTGGNRPFTVLKITVPADRLDVNVHPTKNEVGLLDEEMLLGRLVELVQAALLEAASERQLDTMKLQRTAMEAVKAAPPPTPLASQKESQAGSSSDLILSTLQKQISSGSWQLGNSNNNNNNNNNNKVNVVPSMMVRVERQKGALDSFLRPKNSPTTTTFTMKSDSSETTQNNSPTEMIKTSTSSSVGSPQGIKREEVRMENVLASLMVIPEEGEGEEDDGVSRKRVKKEEESDKVRGDDDDDDEDDDDVMADFKRYRKEVFDLAGEVKKEGEEGKGKMENVAASEHPTHTSSILFANVSDWVDQQKENSNHMVSDKVKTPASEAEDVLTRPNYILSSVESIVHHIHRSSTSETKSFIDGLSLVGVVNNEHFLCQYSTSLLVVNTLHLVREVVYQRIFLRWMDPSLQQAPCFRFSEPLSIAELLFFSLKKDTAQSLAFPLHALFFQLLDREESSASSGMNRIDTMRFNNSTEEGSRLPMSRERQKELLSKSQAVLFEPDGETPRPITRKYIKRLVQRLVLWRPMLEEYYHIVISEEGHLLGLPYGLNDAWPPPARTVPLFLWLLAEAVSFPMKSIRSTLNNNDEETAEKDAERLVEEEKKCLDDIARHIANTLYGLIAPPAVRVDSAGEGRTESLEDFIKFGLFPCMKNKRLFYPPAKLIMEGGGTVVRVVTVESLYSVFERC